jgi:hypothetical protein
MTEEIPAYAAVAMAGLGWLPDTIMTRSVIIRMRRRKPGENVEPYRRRLHAHDGDRIRAQLEVWAGEQGEINWPDLGEIQDRDADVWEALVAVAELAGGDWPARARAAAAALIAVGKDAERSLGLRLLADIKVVFDASYTATISSADLANKLAALEEAPWGDLRGKPLDQRGLAKRLKEYGIKPKMIRGIGGVRGYDAADFTDAWDRYLPPSPGKTATTATSATTHVLGAPNVAVADAVADGVQRVAPQAREKANENGPVAHVAVVADLRTNGKASRACVQCGADDGMTVAQSSDGNTVFLHRECMRFWVRERNEAARATQ